jgi:hypothetical protein
MRMLMRMQLLRNAVPTEGMPAGQRDRVLEELPTELAGKDGWVRLELDWLLLHGYCNLYG